MQSIRAPQPSRPHVTAAAYLPLTRWPDRSIDPSFVTLCLSLCVRIQLTRRTNSRKPTKELPGRCDKSHCAPACSPLHQMDLVRAALKSDQIPFDTLLCSLRPICVLLCGF